MDFTWFTEFVDNALLFLQDWGFLLVILFGILHPVVSNPLHLFNMSLAIALLGPWLGYPIVIVANIIGILFLWYLTRMVPQDNILKRWKISDKVLTWVKETETWRHAIVIGAPTIPTYPVKLAIPLSGMSFKKYMYTLCGSYVVLIVANTLIHYGLVGFITNNVPNWLSFSILLVIVLYIYFGRRLFNRGNLKSE